MEKLTVALLGSIDSAAFDAFCEDINKLIDNYFSETVLAVYPISLFVSFNPELGDRVLDALGAGPHTEAQHFIKSGPPTN